MKKQLLILTAMVTSFTFAQIDSDESTFDGDPVLLNGEGCNGGLSYAKAADFPDRVANPVENKWFGCGNFASITDLNGNNVLEIAVGGSTPVRYTIKDVTPGSTYRIALDGMEAGSNTRTKNLQVSLRSYANSDATLTMFSWVKDENGQDVKYSSTVQRNNKSIVIYPTAFNASSFTTLAFEYTVPSGHTNLVLQLNRAKDEGKDATYIDNVYFEATPSTLSVSALEKYGFVYAVKSSSNTLYVSADETIQNVAIYNLVGQLVLSAAVNKSEANINIDNLNSGVYVIKASINGAIGTYKFIKS